MEFIEKIIDIQTKLNVEKSKYSDYGSYHYRSAEDILKALKPYLIEHKLIVQLNDEVVVKEGRFYIEATATLSDGKEMLSAKASAREPEKPKAKMDESQTTGSTSSYARKYALSGLLGLDDGVDSDSLPPDKKKDDKAEKLITKQQLKELKELGFDDERLQKMATYYKVSKIEEITQKQAEQTINKQKNKIAKEKGGEDNA